MEHANISSKSHVDPLFKRGFLTFRATPYKLIDFFFLAVVFVMSLHSTSHPQIAANI